MVGERKLEKKTGLKQKNIERFFFGMLDMISLFFIFYDDEMGKIKPG
jgi:hypothetical protein